eukprot:m.144474 g.144474  ORF g.144474 m.144474 type:complete len:101 (-) comp13223_c0_seq8:4283-4585(-)
MEEMKDMETTNDTDATMDGITTAITMREEDVTSEEDGDGDEDATNTMKNAVDMMTEEGSEDNKGTEETCMSRDESVVFVQDHLPPAEDIGPQTQDHKSHS